MCRKEHLLEELEPYSFCFLWAVLLVNLSVADWLVLAEISRLLVAACECVLWQRIWDAAGNSEKKFSERMGVTCKQIFPRTLRNVWKSVVIEGKLFWAESEKTWYVNVVCVLWQFQLTTDQLNETYRVETTWYVHVQVAWGTHIVYSHLVKKSKWNVPPTLIQLSDGPRLPS